MGLISSNENCSNNCLICDTAQNVCLLCKHPMSLDRETGSCVSIVTLIPNCFLYSTSDNTKCKLCKDGFFGDNCEACDVNCKNCQDKDLCYVCNSGFSLDNRRCYNRCLVNNCDICQMDTSKCNICVEGIVIGSFIFILTLRIWTQSRQDKM